MKKYDVAGRTVVITGAAGGLGQLLAQALRARKANLVLLDLNADAVAAQAESLGGSRVARGWQADVRDLASLGTAMSEAAEHFGRIDVVIAAAGIGNVIGSLAGTEPEAFERAIDINLVGVWRTFKAAAPYVQQAARTPDGRCLAGKFRTLSLARQLHRQQGRVWALCDSLRLEFRHLGVTVGSVHPTFFKTPMVDEAMSEPGAMRLWGNFEGLFELVSAESVVDGILRGIERRSAQVVAPRTMRVAALAPVCFACSSTGSAFPATPWRRRSNWPRRRHCQSTLTLEPIYAPVTTGTPNSGPPDRFHSRLSSLVS